MTTEPDKDLVTRSEMYAMLNEFIAALRQQQPLSKQDLEAFIKKVVPECYHNEPSGYGGVLKWENGYMQYGGGGSSSGLDLSLCALGYVINPDSDNAAEVKIIAGEIDRIAVAEAKIVVADADFVYVRRTIADNTMLVTHAAAVPANDDTYYYYKLYEFTVADGAASIKKIWRPFAIDMGEDVIPAGGEQYQVLQRDGAGVAVWGWVRWV